MLDLQEYGVTKKGVIITEISKEVETNNIARLHAYEVVVLDVLDPVCVYTFACLEIKTNTETVALRMLENVQTMLVPEARFFYILL